MVSRTDLSKELDLFTDAIEAIPHAIMVINSDMRICSVNRFLAHTLNLTIKEATGKGFCEALGCEHHRDRFTPSGSSELHKPCELRRLVASAFETNAMISRTVSLHLLIGVKVYDLTPMVYARRINWYERRLVVLEIEDIAKLTSPQRQQAKIDREVMGGRVQLIGNHPSMLKVYQLMEQIAATDLPVMIQGETGTGKELVALAIHQASLQAKGHFVPVNCAALPEGLLESELFGHVRGAFTGAMSDRKGRIQLADGGSLLLDEIGELSPPMQAKLLRVLQERSFEMLGSSQTQKAHFRVISADNKDLAQEVKTGRFRADLYYRLCVAVITLPPLRERRSDIPHLVNFFLNREAQKLECLKPILSADAMAAIMEHDWPGNVRELENVIQFAMINSRKGIILPENFPYVLSASAAPSDSKVCRKRKLDTKTVTDMLNRVNGNRLRAAKLLHVSRSTLYRFLDEMEIPPA